MQFYSNDKWAAIHRILLQSKFIVFKIHILVFSWFSDGIIGSYRRPTKASALKYWNGCDKLVLVYNKWDTKGVQAVWCDILQSHALRTLRQLSTKTN